MTNDLTNGHDGWLDDPDHFFDNLGRAMLTSSNAAGRFKTDITEQADRYVVAAELPGFQKKNIHISYQNNNLSIKANHEYSAEQHNDDGHVIRHERSKQAVSRSFYLPNVAYEQGQATYDGGILTITLPKQESGKNQGHPIPID